MYFSKTTWRVFVAFVAVVFACMAIPSLTGIVGQREPTKAMFFLLISVVIFFTLVRKDQMKGFTFWVGSCLCCLGIVLAVIDPIHWINYSLLLQVAGVSLVGYTVWRDL